MAAKSTTYAGNLLALLFNATAIGNVADNAASSPLTNLFTSLHTATPGVGGTQTTNEAAYTSYARVTVARTSGGWTVTAASVSPVADLNFPIATGGSETETFAAVGAAVSGASKIFYFGALSPNIVVTTGVTPVITTGSTVTES